ncbi:OFA family MFS transporter [Nocardioides sp. BGMRC 2183]|nr:OFA family MFS transporter [Nocardioides sp. BGMRC 2183]
MPALSFLDRAHTVARPGYSRWLIPPAALAIHFSIGQAYATSVYKGQLQEHFDAGHTSVGLIFSIAIVVLGLSAALFGTWVDRVGPRKTMFTAACCWASGFVVAAGGVALGGTLGLWVVYLGYGVIGGIGLGLGYISPVSTLIKWFPDRPGLATGMAIMGFGGGAMIASPLSKKLMSVYGGDAGHQVTMLFLTLAAIYFCFMMFGVFLVRVPAPGWHPVHWDPAEHKPKKLQTTAHVSAGNAIRTPQFWLLWVVLMCNTTAGIGILENAGPMIQDFFREEGADGIWRSTLDADPVTVATMAGGFVALLSVGNMAGRFLWSTCSDFVGRKNIYMLYLGGGAVMFLILATAGSTSVALFVLLCMVIVSFYGAGFATVPSYLRDLFGTFQVGAIHGRLLTAWSTAGILGPLIINGVLDSQTPVQGPDPENPSGTVDVLTASDYALGLYIMVGVLAIGFVCNLLIKPVSERFHETGNVTDAADGARSVDAHS